MSENILEVKDLVIHYETDESVVEAVNNITITLEKGKLLGLVGETGEGKTTTAYGIMGLLPPKVTRHSGVYSVGRRGPFKEKRERNACSPRKTNQYDLSGPNDSAESGEDRRRADCRGCLSA